MPPNHSKKKALHKTLNHLYWKIHVHVLKSETNSGSFTWQNVLTYISLNLYIQAKVPTTPVVKFVHEAVRLFNTEQNHKHSRTHILIYTVILVEMSPAGACLRRDFMAGVNMKYSNLDVLL